jgi:PAS domain S-box-containing protein
VSALRSSEGGLLRRLFERAGDGMLVTRLRDGRIVMANEASARLLGVEHGDLVARTTAEIGLWPEQDRQQFVRDVRDEGGAETREVWLDTPTGGRWLELSAELMTMGGRAHLLATLRDITDRKRAEAALRAERDHYAALVAALQDGYYVVNLEGDMIDVNARFCEMVGYTRDEALGVKTPGPWWPPELLDTIMQARRDVMKIGFAEFDWYLLRRGGGRRAVHVGSAVMHDAEGNPSGIVVTVRDLGSKAEPE